MTGRIAMLALVASCFILLGTQGWQIGAFAFALLYGVSQGLISIARGTVPLLLFGPEGYATLTGRVTGIRFFLNAFGPYLFGWLAVASNVTISVAVHGAAALIACLAMFLLKRPKAHPA
jgi:cyanate permease